MDGFTVANGAKTFEFDSKTKSIKCDLECVSKTQCQSHYNTHPLGAWVMNEDMTLREMVTPWGERFRVDAFGTNGPSRVWTSAGVQHFDYNSRGGFKAVTFPNGSRSAVYPIEGQDRALLVGPGAITLLELDKMRRLRKVRSSDGRYSLIDYTRDGQVKSVASFGDTITLFRDNRHRLSAVHSDAGYACHFLNSQSGDLTGFSAEGLRTATSENLLRMLKSLWQCLGLRTVQAFVVC